MSNEQTTRTKAMPTSWRNLLNEVDSATLPFLKAAAEEFERRKEAKRQVAQERKEKKARADLLAEMKVHIPDLITPFEDGKLSLKDVSILLYHQKNKGKIARGRAARLLKSFSGLASSLPLFMAGEFRQQQLEQVLSEQSDDALHGLHLGIDFLQDAAQTLQELVRQELLSRHPDEIRSLLERKAEVDIAWGEYLAGKKAIRKWEQEVAA